MKNAQVWLIASCVAVLCASCGGSTKSSTGSSCNLIVNGNAEATVGSVDGTPVPTPGWASAGEATAAQYGVNSWPALTDPGPTDRGLNLLSGGPSEDISSLTQTANVSQYASSIDTGHVTYALSGWLGGYEDQEDNATLAVTFQDTSGVVLGTVSIGPVTAADRKDATGLLQRSSNGTVPSGTRTVLVVLSLLRTDGTANDGYADDLSLVFSGLTAAVAATCPANGSQPAGAGGSSGGAGGIGLTGAGGSGAAGAAAGASGTGGTLAGSDYTPSADLQSLVAEIAKLKAGQPADLDGDGIPDATQVTNSDGSYVYQDDHDGDGVPEYILSSDGKGKTTVTVDADGDGVAEQVMVTTVTATEQKQVLTVDTDLNGKMDHRYTWVTEAATPDVQSYTAETDAAETGNFIVVSTLQLDSWRYGGTGNCDGMSGFPSGGTNYQPSNTSPTVKTGTDSGQCGEQDSNSIAQALDCALTKGALCLANTNTKEYNNLMAATLGDSKMPLDIGCGNSCSGVIATTKGWGSPWFSNSEMNINPAEWDKLDANGKCNIMLHEMLHWAGDEGSADHNDSSGAGNDTVYSCGRYCGRCSHAGHGSQNNSSVDCAGCADTKARKQQCGARTEYQTAPCGNSMSGFCHAGLACIAGPCQQCGGIVTNGCDGSLIGGNAICCQSCPSNCNQSNDLPCTNTPVSTDTCTDKNPPFCR